MLRIIVGRTPGACRRTGVGAALAGFVMWMDALPAAAWLRRRRRPWHGAPTGRCYDVTRTCR